MTARRAPASMLAADLEPHGRGPQVVPCAACLRMPTDRVHAVAAGSVATINGPPVNPWPSLTTTHRYRATDIEGAQ